MLFISNSTKKNQIFILHSAHYELCNFHSTLLKNMYVSLSSISTAGFLAQIVCQYSFLIFFTNEKFVSYPWKFEYSFLKIPKNFSTVSLSPFLLKPYWVYYTRSAKSSAGTFSKVDIFCVKLREIKVIFVKSLTVSLWSLLLTF